MSMNTKRGRTALMAAVLALLAGAGDARAAEVRITGSTTIYPLAQSAAELFADSHPGVSIAVTGSGSSEGIKAVTEGTAEIGSASREAKAKEIEFAQSKGVELTPNVIALDCIVPIVHPSNPVASLTIEQLQGIYAGRIRSWSEVGGGPEPIVVISRDAQSGTYEVWHKLILQGGEQRADAVVEESNGKVAEAVASKKNAIGYVGIGYMSPVVKGVKANGVAATEQTTQNGSYPIARKLYMYTRGTPTGAVKQFIDFMQSPEGATLAEDEGFVPIAERMAAK